jgi:hypothetical protein
MVAPLAPIRIPSDQILMSSTFPIQIVQAARWLEKQPGLKEKALEDALKSQTWDPSVKSICGFPDVLKRLNENLDWTADMGEAFMNQRTQVLDAVQRMRGKAYENGSLKTTEQQTVTQQPDKIIVIQPSNPEVIYVPQYQSTVVYGSAWAYPTYYYPPAYYGWGYGAMAFTAGFIWGAAMWGGCAWGWGSSNVDIDINRQNNFNGRTDAGFGNNRGDGGRCQSGDKMGNKAGNKAGNKQSWNRNSGASNKAGKYGGSGAGVSNNMSRGYGSRSGSGTGGASVSNRGGAGTGGGSRGPSATPSTRGGSAGSSASPRSSSYGGGSSSYGGRGSSGGGSSAWSGSRGGSASTRSSSSRGGMSRGGGGGRGGRR